MILGAVVGCWTGCSTDAAIEWCCVGAVVTVRRIARVLYWRALIPVGLAQFTYLRQTAVLVPGSLPCHVAWAYLTGATFIAAGVAVIVGICARLAAELSTLQMGSFLLLIWIPRAIEGSLTPFQRGEAVVTCALMAAAWVMTDSYRGTPWFAAKTQRA